MYNVLSKNIEEEEKLNKVTALKLKYVMYKNELENYNKTINKNNNMK